MDNGKPNDIERAELVTAMLKHRDAISDRFEVMEVRATGVRIRRGDHYHREFETWNWRRVIRWLAEFPAAQSQRRVEYLKETGRAA